MQVSQPGDPLEREADLVANEVMSMAEPARLGLIANRIRRYTHRECLQRQMRHPSLPTDVREPRLPTLPSVLSGSIPVASPSIPSPPSSLSDADSLIGVAQELLEAIRQRRLRVQPRDRSQIEQIARTGMVTNRQGQSVIPSPELVATLRTLLAGTPASSRREAPQFAILSLVRFGGGRHAQGRAVDINRYAGHEINVRNLGEALQGILSVIANLPQGCFNLGLPRAPHVDPIGAESDSRTYHGLNLYLPVCPARLRPQFADLPSRHIFFAAGSAVDHPPSRTIEGDLAHIVNAVARAQLRAAIAEARLRGTFILSMFPDALDHLQIQMMPCPPPSRTSRTGH